MWPRPHRHPAAPPGSGGARSFSWQRGLQRLTRWGPPGRRPGGAWPDESQPWRVQLGGTPPGRVWRRLAFLLRPRAAERGRTRVAAAAGHPSPGRWPLGRVARVLLSCSPHAESHVVGKILSHTTQAGEPAGAVVLLRASFGERKRCNRRLGSRASRSCTPRPLRRR